MSIDKLKKMRKIAVFLFFALIVVSGVLYYLISLDKEESISQEEIKEEVNVENEFNGVELSYFPENKDLNFPEIEVDSPDFIRGRDMVLESLAKAPRSIIVRGEGLKEISSYFKEKNEEIMANPDEYIVENPYFMKYFKDIRFLYLVEEYEDRVEIRINTDNYHPSVLLENSRYNGGIQNKYSFLLSEIREYDILRILEVISDNVEYDKEYLMVSNDDMSREDSVHSIKGYFLNNKLVCDGYCDLLRSLLYHYGVPSYTVNGYIERDGEKSDYHSWLRVYDLQEEEWVNIDPTYYCNYRDVSYVWRTSDEFKELGYIEGGSIDE